MKSKAGFSLLEFIIALAIGSLLISQLMQGIRFAFQYVEKGREIMTINRSAAMLMHQLEQDISAAFITSNPTAQPQNPAQPTQTLPQNTKEKTPPAFIAVVEEGLIKKRSGEKKEMLKKVNFISTNSLQLYSEQAPRFVRIEYELVPIRAQKGPAAFSLLRKETENIDNVSFKKEEGSDAKKAAKPIRVFTVARFIKELSLTYVMPQEKKKEDTRSQDGPLVSSAWGETKETKDRIPFYIELHLVMWNSSRDKDYTFKSLFPLHAYSEFPGDKKP